MRKTSSDAEREEKRALESRSPVRNRTNEARPFRCPVGEPGLNRRDWFRLAVGGASALGAGFLTGCGLRASACKIVPPSPFMEGGRPLLVSVQGEDLTAMLRAGIEVLGGLDRLLPLGREAVFRGNYVAPQPYPVSTPVEMIIAVARELSQCGFRRNTLFDSHGTRLVKAAEPEWILRRLGVIDEVRRHGIDVSTADYFDQDEFRQVRNPAWQIGSPVAVHRMLHEAPVVISLPVVKRHGGARFTCALKMHFGSVAMADRLVTHKNEGDSAFLDQRLVHFADAVKPQLTIVDARAILARNGPTLSSGGEVVKGVNRIILCADMVATDAYCAQLMAEHDKTFSVEMIAPQLKIAAALGLGVADLSAVKVVEIKV